LYQEKYIMEPKLYLAFVAATALMIALPGPSVLLTVAHSITYGWRQALSTVAGETLGIAFQLLIAAIGLVSLLHLVSEVFDLLRLAGAAYLVYLGIRQWRKASGAPQEIKSAPASKKSLFMQGLVVTIPNPKSLLFIAAFLPQFINTAHPLGMQFAFIVPTFLLITFTVTSAWAVIAGSAGVFLRNQRALQSVSRASGGLMIFAGLGLAMARRGN
jgi:homoserine/homoserine lactone efflux protein